MRGGVKFSHPTFFRFADVTVHEVLKIGMGQYCSTGYVRQRTGKSTMVRMAVGDDDVFDAFQIDVVFFKDGKDMFALADIPRINEGVLYVAVFLIRQHINIGPVTKEKIFQFDVGAV